MMKWEDFTRSEDLTTYPRYVKTEIECPSCGEKIYEDMHLVYLSNPPKHGFHCFKCGWSGIK